MIYQVEAVDISIGVRGEVLLEAMIDAGSVTECWYKGRKMLEERGIQASVDKVWLDVEEDH